MPANVVKPMITTENIFDKYQAKRYFDKGLDETNLSKKIEFYNKTIELDPTNSDAYNNKGIHQYLLFLWVLGMIPT
jgi:hypothetical protein